MQIVQILIAKNSLFPLDYESEMELEIGELVIVPFRSGRELGIVWKICDTSKFDNLRKIDSADRLSYRLSSKVLRFMRIMSDYYLSDLGSIAKLVIPVDITEGPIKSEAQDISQDKIDLAKLSKEQEKVLETIKLEKNKPHVIEGVTGSGKTEIYFHLILEQLNMGRQSLILLPEIALSRQIMNRFKERFGFEAVIWNSRVTKSRKKKIIRGIIAGDIKVVIGARSALFLPYKDLNLIVVDEEHDISYKQSDGISYHGRDMAVLRATIEGSIIVLGSATISIESMYNIERGKYNLVKLENRFNEALMPEVEIVNMKDESLAKDSYLAVGVIDQMRETIEKGEQVLIFLNRRGYAPLMLCKGCGHRFGCNSCSSWMVYHKERESLECHHCGSSMKVPSDCPECESGGELILCGPGIERIAEQLNDLFKSKEIATLSREELGSISEVEEILDRMESGLVDILIGTQMVTKGYHFPKLTLVVVVDADMGLVGGDLRSTEKNYQLMKQVGGRAGRGLIKGKVILQTYYPDQDLIKSLLSGDSDNFIQEELRSREENNLTPFSKMATMIISGKDQNSTFICARQIVAMAPILPSDNLKILGPVEANMLKRLKKYRYKILIIAERNFALQKYLKIWKSKINDKISTAHHCKIDIDPYHFI